MVRTLVLDLPGLNGRLLRRLSDEQTPSWFKELCEVGQAVIRPVLPAVTMPVQASYTTGVLPSEHGIVANGLAGFHHPDVREHLDMSSYADYRPNVSFWEQANGLVTAPRVWEADGRKTAMLMVQSSMGAADVVVTPKPHHTPDGKTVLNCWTNPADLNDRLLEQLGDFPLHHYWGPVAGLPSSQWIAAAARLVWEWEGCDLNWVYIPHLDYDMQRVGPNDEKMVTQLSDVLGVLSPLVERVHHDGGRVVLLSEYGMTQVSRYCALNVHLREAGLLQVKEGGEMDYDKSQAFALCDHQVAHIYVKEEGVIGQVQKILEGLEEVDKVYVGDARGEVGLLNERSGELVVFSHEDAWFEYRWWSDWSEAPGFAYDVDIHRKPGYDPTELFMDIKTRKVRAEQPELIKGSHGALPKDELDWPVLLGVEGAGEMVDGVEIAKLV